MKSFRNLGPGLLVTAAFIGPGTVTAASKAGASFGFVLLWAVLFSIVATIVLQEMAARLGVVGQRELGDAIRSSFTNQSLRRLAIGFVILAIGFGNAAYQTGNVTGASVGLRALVGGKTALWSMVIGVVSFALLWTGTYKIIERVLIVLVIVMSLTFLVTAILSRPNVADLLRGLFVPGIPNRTALATVIALIGTTVVPYNLFLHASTVREKWADAPTSEALAESRRDTVLSISIGGLITIAIVTTAAAAFFAHGKKVEKLEQFADQLAPILGATAAKVLFALGLLAAGLTSAITAPLAAAYAIGGALGWQRDLKSARFRATWILILSIGVILAATLGASPGETIFVAQVANGFLLPIIAIFLLMAVNRRDLMGSYANGRASNVLGIAVVIVAAGLGIWKIVGQFTAN